MAAPPTVIVSRVNPRVKQLRGAFAGNARLGAGLAAIEGETLIEEALRSGLALKTVFVSERREAPWWVPRGVEVLYLTGEVFASAVDTVHPQGIAALVEPPAWGMEAVRAAGGLLLIAAGLQDPGNMGTLVRSAEACGASAVLATPGTVSEWNQKAVRASAGSVFRMPVVGVTEAEVEMLRAQGVRVYAAVAGVEEDAVAVSEVDLGGECAVMVGNEGAGIGEEWLALADARVTIPMTGPVESLNVGVAGSLLLYEAARQRAVVDAAAMNGARRARAR
jgi:TrmH family RNA methyltransferase